MLGRIPSESNSMTNTCKPALATQSRGLILVGLVALMGCLSCGAVTRKVAREATPAAVDSGVKAATSEKNQRVLVDSIDPEMVEEATEKTVSGSMDGMVAALSEEERQEQLAAAMRPLVASLVDSSVDSALNDENLARIRELAKQATLGFQDAIDEVQEQKEEGTIPQDEGNVLTAADEVAESGEVVLYVLGALALVLALLLIAGTWWALRKKRRYDEDSARRDREIAKITQMLASEGLAVERPSNGSQKSADNEDDDEELLRQAMRRLAERRNSEGAPTSTIDRGD